MPGTLSRWEPFAELGELRTRFDRMFDELTGGGERTWMPAIDVERDNGNLIVRADVPGIKPEEVKIEVQNDILTVSGEHEEKTEEKDKHYLRRERRYGVLFEVDGAAGRRRGEEDQGQDPRRCGGGRYPVAEGGPEGDRQDHAVRRVNGGRLRPSPAAAGLRLRAGGSGIGGV